MRTTITIVIAFMHCMAFGQITLEHTYPNAGYFFSYGQLMMVDLEVSGMSYVKIDRAAKEMKLYHMDHTLFKTVSYATFPQGMAVDIMYISEHLFDTDDGLEFMYLVDSPNLTQVYNEDGSLLFNEQASPFVRMAIPAQQLPIYNTDEGTKLILSHTDGTARVYSLGGTLSVGIATVANEQFQQLSAASQVFPNPTITEIHLALASTLPQNGELIITDATGRVVQTLPIAQGTSQVTQDVSDLPDGAYLYRLTSGGIPFTSGTFVRAR